MKTRKRELVRELLFSKSLGKSQTSGKKRVARSRDRRAQNDLYLPRSPSERSQYSNLIIIVSSSLDAENAQNAPSFCISLVRSRDEIETKRKEACELTERFKEERETTSHTNLSLSLSLGFRSFAVSFVVVKGHSRRERGFSSRCWSLSSQRGKRHMRFD